MSKISPRALRSRPWHEGGVEKSAPRAGSWALELAAPLVVVLLFAGFRAYRMAAVAGALSLAVILARRLHSGARRRIDQILRGLGHWAGQTVTVVLLAPVFYIGMTAARMFHRLSGGDPLQLRAGENPTFWLPCDTERRQARFIQAMFCAERLVPGRLSLVPLAVLAALLLLAAETGLRVYGLRDAVVYVQDYDVGYYPRPDQRVRHPGRIIVINHLGMRGPEAGPAKAPGRFRILLLGDSTLAGTRVSNSELYSALLERQLNEAAGSPKFEVLNLGVNGWGPHHELAYVRKFGGFGADLAVVCGPVWDCYRPRYGLERLPLMPRPPRAALEHVAYQLVWRMRERWLGVPPFSWPDHENTQADAGVEAYGELAGRLQREGAEVMFQMLPLSQVSLGQAPEDPKMAALFQKVRSRLRPLGVYANCAGPIFKDAERPREIYHDGVHFGPVGHRLYARYLFEQLRQHSPRVQAALQPP